MSEPTPPVPGPPSPRTEVRRGAARARYDRETVHAILDAGVVAHVAWEGAPSPFVVPTVYARVGEVLYLHGSPAARWLRGKAPRPMCLAVTIVDGLVLARSAFHHSMNYRSVVVFGAATPVVDLQEKARALDAIVDHQTPGRSRECRRANERELLYTAVAALPIREASAKVRRGDPVDDAEDLALPIWAGTIPLSLVPGAPMPSADLPRGFTAPPSLTGYVRPTSHPTSRADPRRAPEHGCASASSATPTTTSATSGGSSSS